MTGAVPGPGLAARALRLALGIHVGVLVGVGACAAPALFDAVPARIPTREAAGAALGPVFVAADTVGAILALLALFLARWSGAPWRTRRRTGALGTLVTLALVSRLVIDPALVARTPPLGAWHAAAMGSWLASLVLATALSLLPARHAD